MPKIMIADDSYFIRSKLVKLLAKHGYETVQAENGAEAVRIYHKVQPDAVLMDITMPRKNGLEALSEILKFDPLAQVIMLTALDQRSVAATAMMFGARDFLAKPVRPDLLLKALDKALRSRAQASNSRPGATSTLDVSRVGG